MPHKTDIIHRKPELEKPSRDPILRTLVFILDATARQNKILRETEANNERRHKELLEAIKGKDASKIVFTKIRREPIT